MLNTRYAYIFTLDKPFRVFIWLSNSTHTTSPPSLRTNSIAAFKVPPVANTSSISTTLSPGCSNSFWTSITSLPYSKP